MNVFKTKAVSLIEIGLFNMKSGTWSAMLLFSLLCET